MLVAAMSKCLKEVVVAHRDKLCRFAFDLIEWIISQNGAKLVVLDHQIHCPESEFTEDLLSIVHVFPCRFNGMRSVKRSLETQIEGEEPTESSKAKQPQRKK